MGPLALGVDCSGHSERYRKLLEKDFPDSKIVMRVKANIAVIILTYNESVHIQRALEHIGGFAREIFLVDSFSTDNTVEIAETWGAKVWQHPFRYQAEQFNWALDNVPVTSDWVMRLDADEIIEADLAEEIVKKLPTLPPDITGVNLNRKTIFRGRFIRHGGRYPLELLRIWRRGKARVEDRWMDEHLYLTEGRSVTFKGGFADHNLNGIEYLFEKHNGYASREVLDVLNRRLHLFNQPVDLKRQSTSGQAKMKRILKESIYYCLPYEISALLYFFFRYVVQLGFLDGRVGLNYHLIQCLYYRFLVGAKLREVEKALKNVTSDGERLSLIARTLHQPLIEQPPLDCTVVEPGAHQRQ
jgi:glycosyltransferase involved in cell wall biosynthesis